MRVLRVHPPCVSLVSPAPKTHTHMRAPHIAVTCEAQLVSLSHRYTRVATQPPSHVQYQPSPHGRSIWIICGFPTIAPLLVQGGARGNSLPPAHGQYRIPRDTTWSPAIPKYNIPPDAEHLISEQPEHSSEPAVATAEHVPLQVSGRVRRGVVCTKSLLHAMMALLVGGRTCSLSLPQTFLRHKLEPLYLFLFVVRSSGSGGHVESGAISVRHALRQKCGTCCGPVM